MPCPRGWRRRVLYNIGWFASLVGPDGATATQERDGTWRVYGVYSGAGETLFDALHAASVRGLGEVQLMLDRGQVYREALADLAEQADGR